jgi:hypothetical protein
MVNALDYGVVGDGQTDDTQALNNALTAAAAQGKNVYLPNGTYNHDGQIEVTGSAGLIGQSGDTILMATDTAHNGANAEDDGYSNRAINVTGDGATIENLTLEGNSTLPRYGGMQSVAVNVQGSDVDVNHVTVDGGTQSQSTFDNGVVVNAVSNSINNVTIADNLVENTNADYIRVAAWQNNGQDNNVSNVTVEGNMTESTAGAAMGDDSYSAIGNNGATISDYTAINNVGIGPKQWGNEFDLEGVQGGTVEDNYLDDEGAGKSAGVVVQVPPSYPGAASSDLTISGNDFVGDGSTNSTFGAVAFWNGASNVSVADNTFTDSDVADISASGSNVSGITLSGNTDTGGALSVNDQIGAITGQT